MSTAVMGENKEETTMPVPVETTRKALVTVTTPAAKLTAGTPTIPMQVALQLHTTPMLTLVINMLPKLALGATAITRKLQMPSGSSSSPREVATTREAATTTRATTTTEGVEEGEDGAGAATTNKTITTKVEITTTARIKAVTTSRPTTLKVRVREVVVVRVILTTVEKRV